MHGKNENLKRRDHLGDPGIDEWHDNVEVNVGEILLGMTDFHPDH
jgi:hypothetical protein